MAKPLIMVETIYDTALAVLDREGVEGLQARRLASELKCSTRTLYEQVGKREALIRQLIAYHFSRLELGFQEGASWQDSAARWSSAMRNALLVHPNLTRLMTYEDRSVIVDYVNQLLKVLLRAGFPSELAMRSCRVLAHTAFSLIRLELDAPPLVDRRRQRNWKEIRFENLLLAEQSTANQAENFQDTPEIFHHAIRWIIEGMSHAFAAI